MRLAKAAERPLDVAYAEIDVVGPGGPQREPVVRRAPAL